MSRFGLWQVVQPEARDAMIESDAVAGYAEHLAEYSLAKAGAVRIPGDPVIEWEQVGPNRVALFSAAMQWPVEADDWLLTVIVDAELTATSGTAPGS